MVLLYLEQKTLAPCFTPSLLLVLLLKYISAVPSCKVTIISVCVWGNLKGDDAYANVKFQTEYIRLEVKHLLSVENLCELSDSTMFFNVHSNTFGGEIAIFINKLTTYTYYIGYFAIYWGIYFDDKNLVTFLWFMESCFRSENSLEFLLLLEAFLGLMSNGFS